MSNWIFVLLPLIQGCTYAYYTHAIDRSVTVIPNPKNQGKCREMGQLCILDWIIRFNDHRVLEFPVALKVNMCEKTCNDRSTKF